jgi:hypothetical protein
MAETGSPTRQRGLILTLSALALAAAIVSAALLAVDERLPSFLVALGSGGALLLSGVKAAEAQDTRVRFADSVAERMVDAVLLGTLAMVAIPDEGAVAAAAVAALVASYLASYLRARAAGLGFRVEETPLERPIRMIFVALGLLGPAALGALWVATAISFQSIIVRAIAVARQRESR